jgi:hypothetical protein
MGGPRSAVHDWRSSQRQTPAGAVESTQTARLERPAVATTEAGAVRLAALYWAAIVATTGGVVRVAQRADGVELRLLRRGPALLRFGPPEPAVGGDQVECRLAIRGGLLARTAAGHITLSQRTVTGTEVRSAVVGFFPSLAARPGGRSWTGALYTHVQSRIHIAVGRRWFDRLAAESA